MIQMNIHIVFEKLCCFSLEKRAASIDNTTFLMAKFVHIIFLTISAPAGLDHVPALISESPAGLDHVPALISGSGITPRRL
jgi:hypothetical protein